MSKAEALQTVERIETQAGGSESKPIPLVPGPQAILAVFSETNQHLRNAEQKQLTITGAYLGMLTVVIVRFTDSIKALHPLVVITVTGTLTVVGCCVFLLQTWCRVWKEHYLEVALQIAQTWNLPDAALPFWLRQTLQEEPNRRLFKAHVDNTLIYLTFGINTLLVLLLCCEAFVLRYNRMTFVVIVIGIGVIYGLFLLRVKRLDVDRRRRLKA